VNAKPGQSAKVYRTAYGKAAEYAMNRFKAENDRKTELAKLNARVPKGMVAHVDPDTGKVTYVKGGKTLSAEQTNNVSGSKQALQQINDLETTLNANGDAFGPVMGRLNALNPYDTASTTVNSQADIAAQTIGKYLEGGKLTDADYINKYKPMLPKTSDTPAAAANKLQLIRRMIANKQKSDLETMAEAGYNVENFGTPQAADPLPTVKREKGSDLVPSAMASDGPPKIKVVNGRTYVFDGNGWKGL
jgi:hypothetical protein